MEEQERKNIEKGRICWEMQHCRNIAILAVLYGENLYKTVPIHSVAT